MLRVLQLELADFFVNYLVLWDLAGLVLVLVSLTRKNLFAIFRYIIIFQIMLIEMPLFEGKEQFQSSGLNALNEPS